MSSRGGANNRRTRREGTTLRVANNTGDEKLTFNRIVGISLVLLFVGVIALQVTCTWTIWGKQEEMVNKFNCTDENCCPLFIDFRKGIVEEYGSNIFCYFVVYGSSFSAVCSAMMIVILVARIIACKW